MLLSTAKWSTLVYMYVSGAITVDTPSDDSQGDVFVHGGHVTDGPDRWRCISIIPSMYINSIQNILYNLISNAPNLYSVQSLHNHENNVNDYYCTALGKTLKRRHVISEFE